MKKMLLPLLCCLLAVQACKMDGTYTASNVRDIVTVTNGRLETDLGATYTVVKTVSTPLPALVEGNRYLLLFDILNEGGDIFLKNVTPVTIKAAGAKAETTDADPVIIRIFWANHSFVDLSFDYYKSKTSNFAHQFSVQYDWDPGACILHLYLYHNGNGEHPAAMEPETLELENTVISVPVHLWPQVQQVVLTYHTLLRKDASSPWEVQQVTMR